MSEIYTDQSNDSTNTIRSINDVTMTNIYESCRDLWKLRPENEQNYIKFKNQIALFERMRDPSSQNGEETVQSFKESVEKAADEIYDYIVGKYSIEDLGERFRQHIQKGIKQYPIHHFLSNDFAQTFQGFLPFFIFRDSENLFERLREYYKPFHFDAQYHSHGLYVFITF